uniref:PAP-associated domain-containing protein n=1 Tax=Parastrongyloides trichosuri TaxID=131310 RepID=A0A0N4ZTY5_PARTI
MNQKEFTVLLEKYGIPPFVPDLDEEVNSICKKLKKLHLEDDNYWKPEKKMKPIENNENSEDKISQIYERYTKLCIGNISFKFENNLDWLEKTIKKEYYRDCQKHSSFLQKCHVVRIIGNILKKIKCNSFIFMTGSTITFLGDDNADVDLCWVIPGYGINNLDIDHLGQRMKIIFVLKEASNYLKNKLHGYNCLKNIQVIESTVPILQIKFLYNNLLIEMDISVNNLPGIMNSKLLHYYHRHDIRFAQLVTFFKKFCKQSGYKNAFNNCLNSYSISLMVLHFLQIVVEPPILPNLQKLRPDIFGTFELIWFPYFQKIKLPKYNVKKNETPVSELYLQFLKYFGTFNSKCLGISISKNCILPRKKFEKNKTCKPLFIEEPYEENNTARSLTQDNWTIIQKNLIHEFEDILQKKWN